MATRDIAAEINAAVAAGNDALTNQLLAERYAKISADPALMAKYGTDAYSQAYTGLMKAQGTPVVTSTPTSTPATTPTTAYTPVSTPAPVAPSTPAYTPVTPTTPTSAPSPAPAPVPTSTTNTAAATTVTPRFAATGNSAVDSILQQMVSNSTAWKTATPEVQKQLAAANESLANQLGNYGIAASKNAGGQWNVLDYSGQAGTSSSMANVLKAQNTFQTQVNGSLQGQTVETPLGGSVTFAPDPIIPPAQYITMTPEQIFATIQNSTTNVTQIFALVQQLAQQAVNAGNVDVTAAVKTYLDQIESSLSGMQAKYDQLYADGPNDPGLQAALQMMRESAEETRQQMLEELNARGLSRSGLLVKAEERFVKGAASQEAQVIGQFMSGLYQTYMNAMQNITNQRVGVLAQMGQLVGEAAIQGATNRVNALNAAMGAMTDIGQTMASMNAQAWQTAYDAYGNAMQYNETARHNYTTEQEQRRANMAQEGLTQQGINQQGNMDFLKLQETTRSNIANETLSKLQLDNNYTLALKQIGIDTEKLQEQIRSNKASESIARSQVSVERDKLAENARQFDVTAKQTSSDLLLRAKQLNIDLMNSVSTRMSMSMQNSLNLRQIKLEEDKLKMSEWQNDVAKAEMVAAHAANTQKTLEDFMAKVDSGEMTIKEAQDYLPVIMMTIQSGKEYSDSRLEDALYKQVADKINAKASAANARTEAWNEFMAGLGKASSGTTSSSAWNWYTPMVGGGGNWLAK